MHSFQYKCVVSFLNRTRLICSPDSSWGLCLCCCIPSNPMKVDKHHLAFSSSNIWYFYWTWLKCDPSKVWLLTQSPEQELQICKDWFWYGHEAKRKVCWRSDLIYTWVLLKQRSNKECIWNVFKTSNAQQLSSNLKKNRINLNANVNGAKNRC